VDEYLADEARNRQAAWTGSTVVESTERLKHLPAFIASQEGGEGFAEIAQTILAMRTAK